MLVATMLLAGCGDPEPGRTADEPDGSTAPEPRTSTPAPGRTTTPPGGALQKIRVVGEVVEVGDCVAVRDDHDITWTVTGPAADGLVLGVRVQVTGAPRLHETGCRGPVVRATSIRVVD